MRGSTFNDPIIWLGHLMLSHIWVSLWELCHGKNLFVPAIQCPTRNQTCYAHRLLECHGVKILNNGYPPTHTQ